MSALEKKELKGLMRELIREDRAFIRQLMQEILADETAADTDRQRRVDAIIRRDFERYKNVFKALA